MSNNIEIGILNVVASVILLISCVVITIYYNKRDKQENEIPEFSMKSICLVMCFGSVVILCLMGANLIFRG